jgi:hypothetical protein
MIWLWGIIVATTGPTSPTENSFQQLQATVAQFRARMEIRDEVAIRLVDQNPRLVSVSRSRIRPEAFVIDCDQAFFAQLSEEEQRAAIAHELGHVWLFTHHPFLQTEALANQKALQVVSQESLTAVYEKVWKHEGKNGSLEEFLARVH